MVGASLAAALSATPYRIGILEAKPFGAPGQPSYDDRSIALAYGSRRILEGMGLWSAFAGKVTPIEKIHVSDRGHFGAARLDCREEGVEALGYVAENRIIGQVLNDYLAGQSNIEWLTPASLARLKAHAQGVEVELEKAGKRQTRSCRLLVAADGTHSRARAQLGIEARQSDYRQAALIANVTPERHHNNVAYERFTDAGPLALLPMSEGRCSLVWTHAKDELAATEALSDEAFLAKLQARFGHRLGRFIKVGARQSYPLVLTRAQEDIGPRAVLIGNAAHTLHPVAGQGFNLALRDVAVLAELLVEALAANQDPGTDALLQAYADWRRRDLDTVVRYTDGLARLFANPWAPLRHARAAGLIAVDLVAPLRHLLARQSMGLRHRLPRLARGLPLSGVRA